MISNTVETVLQLMRKALDNLYEEDTYFLIV